MLLHMPNFKSILAEKVQIGKAWISSQGSYIQCLLVVLSNVANLLITSYYMHEEVVVWIL